jgi:hypothetical protein
VIVRGSALRKGAKSAQKPELLVAKKRDINEGLRSSQHGKQAQQQYLRERIPNFADLAGVRQILEIPQKDNRFLAGTTAPRNVHRRPPPRESEDNDRFSTLALCHALPSPDRPGWNSAES